jgi:hypothetical protein
LNSRRKSAETLKLRGAALACSGLASFAAAIEASLRGLRCFGDFVMRVLASCLLKHIAKARKNAIVFSFDARGASLGNRCGWVSATHIPIASPAHEEIWTAERTPNKARPRLAETSNQRIGSSRPAQVVEKKRSVPIVTVICSLISPATGRAYYLTITPESPTTRHRSVDRVRMPRDPRGIWLPTLDAFRTLAA